MKRILFLICCFLAIAMTPATQQSKRVYITLDVSGSMMGNKFILANYTTQMIVTLCDDDDEISLIVAGHENVLTKHSDPLKLLQNPLDYAKNPLVLKGSNSPNDEINDIITFNKLYKPSNKKQNWLFIIGDGVWDYLPTYPDAVKDFKTIIETGTLNVCYLQTENTLNANTGFTKYAETLGVVDIGKSDTDPQTIIKGCDHFAKKILGFSEVELKKKKVGSQCISLTAELPITEFILVYQDKVVPDQLPNISNATANGNNLKVKLKGTPTTIPVKNIPADATLSGHVWRVEAGRPILANKEIKVCFDKSIDLDKISIYPIVKNVEFEGLCIAPVDTKLKKLKDNTFSICRDENTAKVRVELSEDSKENLPEALLKKTNVVVKANNKEYKANYKDGGFECEIELMNEETQYYAECDCPGYFKRVTPIITIVKGDCEKIETQIIQEVKPAVEFPTMTFEQLKIQPIKGRLTEGDTDQTLDPSKYDIEIEVENGVLFEKPKLRIEGGEVVFDLKPKGGWCECLFPKEVNIKIVSTPKEGVLNGESGQNKQIVRPIHFKLEKTRSWVSRCLWVIVALGGLLLLLYYLLLLLKKRRFKKDATVTPIYYDRYGEEVDDGAYQKLRKKGFAAWLARWFWPGAEKNTLSFFKPNISAMTFVASNSQDAVEITASSIDPDRMTIANFTPDQSAKIADNSSIYINDGFGNQVGYLRFNAYSKQDGSVFRILLGILVILDILAILTLLFFMIRSFL